MQQEQGAASFALHRVHVLCLGVGHKLLGRQREQQLLLGLRHHQGVPRLPACVCVGVWMVGDFVCMGVSEGVRESAGVSSSPAAFRVHPMAPRLCVRVCVCVGVGVVGELVCM